MAVTEKCPEVVAKLRAILADPNDDKRFLHMQFDYDNDGMAIWYQITLIREQRVNGAPPDYPVQFVARGRKSPGHEDADFIFYACELTSATRPARRPYINNSDIGHRIAGESLASAIQAAYPTATDVYVKCGIDSTVATMVIDGTRMRLSAVDAHRLVMGRTGVLDL